MPVDGVKRAPLLSSTHWRKRAEELTIRSQAFIGGRFVPARSEASFKCTSPIDGTVLAHVSSCQAEDVDSAVSAAREAFDSGVWCNAPAGDRKRVLTRLAELIQSNTDELALLETLDTGRSIANTLTFDLPRTAECFTWYAEALDKLYDDAPPAVASATVSTTREPVGVVAAVLPWNFPLLMAAWKVAPALAAGNTIILKPAEQAPLTALRLAELAAQAGIPDGVFNVCPGDGPIAGRALGLHNSVDCLSFTGSVEIGKLFLTYSGQSNMKRVWIESGGKSPQIVFADAYDLDTAARSIAYGIFYNQGQMCSAGSRLLVEKKIKDELLARLIEWAHTLRPQDPLDPTSKVGAVIDHRHLNSIKSYVEMGKKEGAQLVDGGEQLDVIPGGCYFAPTIFDSVSSRMEIAQQEIFGPVLCTIPVNDYDDALRIANDTIYGLAAAVWTSDIAKAHRAAKAIRAGTVWVNCYDAGNLATPVGGFKQSGFGKSKSLRSFDRYMDLKTIWVNTEGARSSSSPR